MAESIGSAAAHSKPVVGVWGRAMDVVRAQVAGLAAQHARVVLHGPRGAGKESVARFYADHYCDHDATAAHGPFVAVDCSTLGEGIAATELFGYAKGAFTGAFRDTVGLFETANGGILFLDEVADLPPSVQAQLLRALDPGFARRLGAMEDYSTTGVTVIAATERPLDELRPSLRDRLGFEVHVPGLSDRPDELLRAIEMFVRRALRSRRDDRRGTCLVRRRADGEIDEQAVDELARAAGASLLPIAARQPWPGSFRTLRRYVEFATFLAGLDTEQRFLADVESGFCEACGASPAGQSARADDEVDDRLRKRVEKNLTIRRRLAPGDAALARFIAARGARSFSIYDVVAVHAGRSRRTLQDRLSRLQPEILEQKPRGVYRLVNAQARPSDLPSSRLPPTHRTTGDGSGNGCAGSVQAVIDALETTGRIYFTAADDDARAAFVRKLAERLDATNLVFWCSVGEDLAVPGGLLDALVALLESSKVVRDVGARVAACDRIEEKLALLAGFVALLHMVTRQRLTLLIENPEDLKSRQARAALIGAISRLWLDPRLVIISDRRMPEFPGVAPEQAFAELPLAPAVES